MRHVLSSRFSQMRHVFMGQFSQLRHVLNTLFSQMRQHNLLFKIFAERCEIYAIIELQLAVFLLLSSKRFRLFR